MAELLTIGHSTHSLEDFLGLLRGERIQCIADVRRFPGSRRSPQFSREELPGSLARTGVGYEHFPQLGGRRSRDAGAAASAWRVAAFAAYADHLHTPEFGEGRRRLETLARDRRTAIMCAEAPWWRCHRRLIADVFVLAGWTVLHVMPDGRTIPHEPPDFLVPDSDGLPTYPPGGQPPLFGG